MKKLRVGVLASGSGSNLQALIDATHRGEMGFEVAVVVSDNADAEALNRARRAGIPAIHVEPGDYRTRLEPSAEERCIEALEQNSVDVVALAGFMRILHERFLEHYRNRIVNIHPSLLPSFPGLDAQGQAFEYGVKWSGATVHFVDAGVDTGPIIIQAAVPVLNDDTRDTLAARILEKEHEIYPEALDLLSRDRLRFEGRRVLVDEGEEDG